jgi:threonine/homoserine/homoserine lactone efflux protein
MPLHLYLAFAGATAVLMAIPGPNVAIIVAGSLARGPRAGLATVAGTSAAMVAQLLLVALGLASALGALGAWFGEIRWIGVAYLVWLAVRAWRAPPEDLSRASAPLSSPWRLVRHGFLVSLTNPKTLFFYGAFFPQFLSPAAPLGPQLALLAATFLALAVAMDSCWALFAGRLRPLLGGPGRLRHRLTGGVYLAAGIGLAAARKAA